MNQEEKKGMAKGYGKFGGGGSMGNQNAMRKQLLDLQKQMEEQQAKIAETNVTATVGGGAIKITMTGDQVCKSVEIDPDFLKDADAEMLQDIILSGINMALDQSRKLSEDSMGPLSGALSSMGLGF